MSKTEYNPTDVTVETQSPQLLVARQVVSCHCCYLVVGEIQNQSVFSYQRNPAESGVGAVTQQAQVTEFAGGPPAARVRPPSPAQVDDEEGEEDTGLLSHSVKKKASLDKVD